MAPEASYCVRITFHWKHLFISCTWNFSWLIKLFLPSKDSGREMTQYYYLSLISDIWLQWGVDFCSTNNDNIILEISIHWYYSLGWERKNEYTLPALSFRNDFTITETRLLPRACNRHSWVILNEIIIACNQNDSSHAPVTRKYPLLHA